MQAAGTSGGKVTIVSIPGWSFADWNDETLAHMPHLRELIRSGAIGAMNVRTPERGLEDSYATFGAGALAVGSAAFDAMERREGAGSAGEADVLYRRRTGWEPSDADIVLPDMAALIRLNAKRDYHARPGLLGELLGRGGIGIAVYGNSDTADRPRRHAPLMLMDESGRVPQGRIGESMLLADSARPSSVRVNTAEMLRLWEATDSPAVVLLEWGDLYRLEAEQSRYEASQAEKVRAMLLSEWDGLLGELAARLRPGDSLWVLSPLVGADAYSRKERLAPIIRFELGMTAGLLTSPSTRRDGIVTATDVAPSILAAYGLSAPDDMIGRTMSVVPQADAWPKLRRELDSIREVYIARPHILLPFVTCEAIMLLVALLALWGKQRKAAAWIVPLLLAMLAAPPVLLGIGWLSAIRPIPSAGQAALFLAGTVTVALVLAARRPAFEAAAWLGGITALLLLADGLTGGEGMKRSVLGYDPMIGARYYGMGNEYMGVLVGSVTLAFAALMEHRFRTRNPGFASAATAAEGSVFGRSEEAERSADRAQSAVSGEAAYSASAEASRLHANTGAKAKVIAGERESAKTEAKANADASAAANTPAAPALSRVAAFARRRRAERLAAALAAAAFAAVAGYLAAPRLGTNAGGAVTAAVAFGLAWLRSHARGFMRGLGALRLACVVAALVAAGFAALWLLNAAAPATAGGQSHIGRAIDWLGHGRADLVAAMIGRKLRMNAHLIGVSAWTKVLAAGLLAMAFAVVRPRGAFRRWETSYPHCMGGFMAIAVGAVAALLFNDSGIVAAAAMIVYAAVPMLLLRFQEDSSSHSA
jgi:hypothetical protein